MKDLLFLFFGECVLYVVCHRQRAYSADHPPIGESKRGENEKGRGGERWIESTRDRKKAIGAGAEL